MMQEMRMEDIIDINGGGVEDVAFGLGVALGAAGAVVGVAAAPFTGGVSLTEAAVAGGLAMTCFGTLMNKYNK